MEKGNIFQSASIANVIKNENRAQGREAIAKLFEEKINENYKIIMGDKRSKILRNKDRGTIILGKQIRKCGKKYTIISSNIKNKSPVVLLDTKEMMEKVIQRNNEILASKEAARRNNRNTQKVKKRKLKITKNNSQTVSSTNSTNVVVPKCEYNKLLQKYETLLAEKNSADKLNNEIQLKLEKIKKELKNNNTSQLSVVNESSTRNMLNCRNPCKYNLKTEVKTKPGVQILDRSSCKTESNIATNETKKSIIIKPLKVNNIQLLSNNREKRVIVPSNKFIILSKRTPINHSLSISLPKNNVIPTTVTPINNDNEIKFNETHLINNCLIDKSPKVIVLKTLTNPDPITNETEVVQENQIMKPNDYSNLTKDHNYTTKNVY